MEVSDQIIKVLDEIGKRFGMVIDWTQANVLPYVQQLGQRIVNYELWTSIVWIVFSFILLVISILIFKRFYKRVVSMNESEFIPAILMSRLSIAGIGVSIVVIVNQTFDVITCLTLPEKVIFEFVKQYIH